MKKRKIFSVFVNTKKEIRGIIFARCANQANDIGLPPHKCVGLYRQPTACRENALQALPRLRTW